MKYCPKGCRYSNDDLKFCLDHGDPLHYDTREGPEGKTLTLGVDHIPAVTEPTLQDSLSELELRILAYLHESGGISYEHTMVSSIGEDEVLVKYTVRMLSRTPYVSKHSGVGYLIGSTVWQLTTMGMKFVLDRKAAADASTQS